MPTLFVDWQKQYGNLLFVGVECKLNKSLKFPFNDSCGNSYISCRQWQKNYNELTQAALYGNWPIFNNRDVEIKARLLNREFGSRNIYDCKGPTILGIAKILPTNNLALVSLKGFDLNLTMLKRLS